MRANTTPKLQEAETWLKKHWRKPKRY
jgi:hypothetical protein